MNKSPINEFSRGSHRYPSSHRGFVSSVNKHPTERLNARNDRSKEVPLSTTSRSRIQPDDEKSQTLKSPGSINIPKKPVSVPTEATSYFMPRNDDLRNKVIASLKIAAATKDQIPVKQNSPATTEPIVSSSPQKQRESRVLSVEGTSPSTRHGIRVAAGSHRRISQSSTSSNQVAIDCRHLEGIRSIQSTSADNISDQVISFSMCVVQTLNPNALFITVQEAKVGNAGASSVEDGLLQKSDPVKTISKDQLNRYIRTLDNHQRRQLVEQPRANISQLIFNHLMQENQTALARQLTSLRFGVGSSELIEMTSKTDTHVVLSDELVEQIKVLLAQDKEESVTPLHTFKQTPEHEEEEIQFLVPPPKTPPLCIDLDLDGQPAATVASLSNLPPTSSQQTPRQTQKQPSSVEVSISLACTEKSNKKVPALESIQIDSLPNPGHPQSALKFRLEDFQIEKQQGKSRITEIDNIVEALLLERKSLTDWVHALEQRESDLVVPSSPTNNVGTKRKQLAGEVSQHKKIKTTQLS